MKPERLAKGTHGLLAAIVAMVVVACPTSTSASSQPASGGAPTRPPLPTLRPASVETGGAAAISRLGNQLDAYAAHYLMSGAGLRQRFATDHDLRLTADGHLVYACTLPSLDPTASDMTSTSAQAADAATPDSGTTVAADDDTFLLHSRPGATHIIYLDFIGYTLSGTAWNDTKNSGAAIVAPAWDTDGDASTFSTSERSVIKGVWKRVSEDYAPFDVDVTTEYPGEAALHRTSKSDNAYGMRALISPISSYFGSVGGVAYVGSYDDTSDYYKTAIILSDKLYDNEKYIADAASHEVGHTLGLSHDGTTTGDEYYSGHNYWAPIMGSGYTKPVTQWSKGEYPNANNQQDDLVVMTQNGISLRTDDYGSTLASASALSGTTISAAGVIERATDVDVFSVTTGGGPSTFLVTPAPPSPNLHLRVTIYEAGGNTRYGGENADTSSGAQPVSITLTLSSGVSYVAVEGVGSGTLSTGYSDYDSLGAYTVAITLPPDSTWATTTAGSYSWQDAANWSNGVPSGSAGIARLTNTLSGDQTIALSSSVTLGTLQLGDAGSAHSFTLSGSSFVFATSYAYASIQRSSGAIDVIATPITLGAPLQITQNAGTPLTLGGTVSGAQPVTKLGTGMLIFGGAANYTGDTTVSAGTLALGSSGTLASSPTITLAAGTTFDVSARSSGFTLATAQTLAGTGTVRGTLKLVGTLSPDTSTAAGSLTINGPLQLASGARLAIQVTSWTPAPGTGQDTISVASLATTGTLTTAPALVVTTPGISDFSDEARSFVLLTSSATIPDAVVQAITLDVSRVSVSASGSWSLTLDNSGTELVLVYAPLAAASAYDTWVAGTGLTDSNSAKTADPDGDGVPNALEFALDRNPLSSAETEAAYPVVGTLTVDGVVYPTLTLPVLDGAIFTGSGELVSSQVDGVVYHVQSSTDLVDFTSRAVVEVTGADASVLQASLPLPSSGWTLRTFRSTTPAATDFLRVQIDLQ